ncbi:MAG: MFS transporter [Actinomycetota bacterium]|nr:MFS transporter [Actinomycetota bacterium]
MTARTLPKRRAVPAPQRPGRTGLVLALIVTCQLMIVLDATVVNVALPPIQADLGFSATALSWVVNAYTLAFGGLAVAAFATAAVLLAGFIAIEQRAEQPLLPLRLFERRVTASAYLTMLLVPAVLLGMYFFAAQFLQLVLGYSAMETGFAFLPMAALIFAGSQTVPRFGPRPFMIAGAVALLAATLWLTQLSASNTYIGALAGPLTLFGLGGGLLFMPLSAVLLSGVRLADSGAAAGAMQTAQQLGAALGVAILVSVFAAAAGGAGETEPGAFAAGAADAFVASAAFAVVALVLILTAVRPSQITGADSP